MPVYPPQSSLLRCPSFGLLGGDDKVRDERMMITDVTSDHIAPFNQVRRGEEQVEEGGSGCRYSGWLMNVVEQIAQRAYPS